MEKYWKKKLVDFNWQGPTKSVPSVPKEKLSDSDVQQIVKLRTTTGWGALILEQIFKFPISESTYKRIIRKNNLSGGSKIENKRIH